MTVTLKMTRVQIDDFLFLLKKNTHTKTERMKMMISNASSQKLLKK